ncbi:hypothetical protein K438DRAFT_1774934 [Mycena galopus ATCC 62051]|nr:hypothetical protein K438DRAFT_1774934 [Mycena galopus ATCC 62051]
MDKLEPAISEDQIPYRGPSNIILADFAKQLRPGVEMRKSPEVHGTAVPIEAGQRTRWLFGASNVTHLWRQHTCHVRVEWWPQEAQIGAARSFHSSPHYHYHGAATPTATAASTRTTPALRPRAELGFSLAELGVAAPVVPALPVVAAALLPAVEPALGEAWTSQSRGRSGHGGGEREGVCGTEGAGEDFDEVRGGEPGGMGAKVPLGEVAGFGGALEVKLKGKAEKHTPACALQTHPIELERADADIIRDIVCAGAIAQGRAQPRVIAFRQALRRYHPQVRAACVDQDVQDIPGDADIRAVPQIVPVNEVIIGVRF